MAFGGLTFYPDTPLMAGYPGSAVDSDGTAKPVVVPAYSIAGADYEAVAASASNQVMGSTGAIGDCLAGLLVIPATTSPGAVSIKDGSGTAITVFTGGATSTSNLVPFFIPLNLASTLGAWQVTTGTNVSVLAIGFFT